MSNSSTHAALPYPIRNARYSVPAAFRISAGNPTDPTTPDTEYSVDGGATFSDTAEEVTTGGANGAGYVTLTGAEMNNALVWLAFKSANCTTSLMSLIPRVLALIGSGTLSAGAAGGGTLGTLLSYDLTGCFIRTTGGTGGGGTGGANNQARKIATYNTSTGAFTVVPNWETTPDATTTYDILLPEGVTLGMLRTLNPGTPGRTITIDASGNARAVDSGGAAIMPAASYTAPDNSGIASAASSAAAAASSAASGASSASTAATNTTSILSRLGAFTGTGVNTLLGFLLSLMKKDATAPSDIGGTFDPATDSLEALRERGDSGAWGSDATAIADSLIAAVDETGLKASSFTPEALDQLRAAEIDLSQWDPDTDPVKIYRGVDHLHATGNAFTFRNVAGNWPDLTGCTIRMELIIDGVTAIAGAGTIVTASGANQEFYIQVLRTAFDGSLIKDKTGVFRCVRIDGSGNRFPLANGVATLFPNTAPAA